jgi:hypothetical protein
MTDKMKKGERVKWVDGLGYEHEGVVERDTPLSEYMIPVKTNDERTLHIKYLNLTIVD